MRHLPRVDEHLQTGIWYPYHRALNNGSWHPVRELYKTHDMFVPDRYAIGQRGTQWLSNTKAATASPNRVVMHRAADGTPVAVPSTNSPQAATSAVAPSVFAPSLPVPGTTVTPPSMVTPTFKPTPAQAAAINAARAKAVKRVHSGGAAAVPVRRKDKKSVVGARTAAPVRRLHSAAPVKQVGRLTNPSAIRQAARTAASVQRPLPANVKVPSTAELKGWFDSLRRKQRGTKTIVMSASRGGNSAVLKNQALRAMNVRNHRPQPAGPAKSAFMHVMQMRKAIAALPGTKSSGNLNGCNWCG